MDLIFDIKYNIAKSCPDAWFLFYLYDDEFHEFALSPRGINEYIRAFTMRTVSVYGIEYRLLAKLHNHSDLPAVITNNGDLYWYSLGLLHRCDGPEIMMFGREEWWKNGTRHRDGDLPAIITREQSVWYANGRIHRDGGEPAIIEIGRMEWYIAGERKRLSQSRTRYL
jgi:hypothetical protein